MTFRADSDGWLRYRGAQGRRGGPSALRTAIGDLRSAVGALTAALDELELAVVVRDDRHRYERLIDSARARVVLGVKFGQLVLKGRSPRKRKVPPATQLRLKLVR